MGRGCTEAGLFSCICRCKGLIPTPAKEHQQKGDVAFWGYGGRVEP